jgi:hypothetical protein
MYKVIFIILLSFLSTVVAAEGCRIFDYKCEGKELSNLVGIESLSTPQDTKFFEVRVWARTDIIELVSGYVLRKQENGFQISTYKNSQDNYTPLLSGTYYLSNAQELIKKTGILGFVKEASDTHVACRVKDGTSYLIEIVHNGKYLGAEAFNPRFCDLKGTKEVMAVLSVLEGAIKSSSNRVAEGI